jgi:hypothetical protein
MFKTGQMAEKVIREDAYRVSIVMCLSQEENQCTGMCRRLRKNTGIYVVNHKA